MTASGDGPFTDRDLTRANTCRTPLCAGGQALDRFDIVVKDIAIHRHCVLHAHYKLDIKLSGNAPVTVHRGGLMNV